jgi:hypothetical protein
VSRRIIWRHAAYAQLPFHRLWYILIFVRKHVLIRQKPRSVLVDTSQEFKLS